MKLCDDVSNKFEAKKKFKKVSKANQRGDCYDVAGKIVLDHQAGSSTNEFESPVLVHGEVTGQGPLKGIRFGHAWIEIGNGSVVVDRSNGRDITVPSKLYYALGKIKKVFKYTPEEAKKKMLKHGTFGPWDLKTKY